jgi:hypothetical protein
MTETFALQTQILSLRAQIKDEHPVNIAAASVRRRHGDQQKFIRGFWNLSAPRSVSGLYPFREDMNQTGGVHRATLAARCG